MAAISFTSFLVIVAILMLVNPMATEARAMKYTSGKPLNLLGGTPLETTGAGGKPLGVLGAKQPLGAGGKPLGVLGAKQPLGAGGKPLGVLGAKQPLGAGGKPLGVLGDKPAP